MNLHKFKSIAHMAVTMEFYSKPLILEKLRKNLTTQKLQQKTYKARQKTLTYQAYKKFKKITYEIVRV